MEGNEWKEEKRRIKSITDTIRYDTVQYGTIRYDTVWYFNVCSKADISQLNLPHGTNN